MQPTNRIIRVCAMEKHGILFNNNATFRTAIDALTLSRKQPTFEDCVKVMADMALMLDAANERTLKLMREAR